ncbi:MAG: TolC family protein [Limnochordaceae bacterium]|nr:TolC family protein [Limnochordaceae bacterium]
MTYTRPLWPPVLTDPTGFEARRVRAGQRQRQLTVDALQTFYGLQQAFAAYRTTWGRAALAQQRYEAAQALVEAGARGPADLLRAQDDLAQSRKELREAWRRTRDALVAFTSTAGLPLPGFAGATTPPAPEALGLELVDDLRWEGALRSLASLVGIEDGSRLDALTTWQSTGQEEALIQAWHSRALEAHPDVADARLAVQEAEVQLARARQAAGPSVQFSAGVVAVLEPGQRADPRLTMSLSQPLWAPALGPGVQEAAAALEAARQRLRSAEEQAIRELDQVWWDLGQAIAAADDARASLSRAEQTLQHALRREQRGLATPIDVEQASLAAEQARADVAAAGNQIRLQWLRLAATLGLDPAWVLETRPR